ncbi:sulfate adenylyltransferase subunit CysN [Pantoea sp. Nvir]|uniref:sulfate adenylyltransferase subunit CysN n=1 Tax=Pantoea sp. Nvir TaxID=2576760 RepID=UPI00135BACBC|nr:sulfate adenylyltransferase subunit CysN [Pantoea sp. Nvir]MXP66730.1 sulfate adenylyltransferase subunit CysN [Pantoea sp. Nvir]
MNTVIARQITAHGGVEAWLNSQRYKGLLRFLTCGSVDDGKSTLIGRLLHDTRQIYEDQLSSLRSDSKRHGTQGEKLDLALLVDGLQAEREQGITIDVAYRYFSTEKRKFIIADTPGHEQYTRNMATGASNCDLAVLLIDVRKGVLDQARRHSFISTLFGIKHVVVAINKMDLVEYRQEIFERIKQDYLDFAVQLPEGLDIRFVPISALEGDNVVMPSQNMLWYSGPSLLDVLETVVVERVGDNEQMRFPVQYVNRPNLDFRGYIGTLSSGVIKIGQRIKVLPSGVESTVARIVTFDGDLQEAGAGEAITLVLDDEIDISRGDLLVESDVKIDLVYSAMINVVWMAEQPLQIGQSYDVKIAAKKTRGRVTKLIHQIEINSLKSRAAEILPLNGIGLIKIIFDEPMVLDKYQQNPVTGGMIFIDRLSNGTVGAGMIHQPLRGTVRHDENVVWHHHTVTSIAREQQHGHRGVLLWFTGLSGSGKSTVAGALEHALHQLGVSTYLLDGDNVRYGLCRDLSFSDADRKENIRRVGEVGKLMVDAGLVVLSALISPYSAERQMVRELLPEGRFIEVFVDTPLAVCKARDPKGLYKKSYVGKLLNFTGIDSAYEAPESPEMRLSGEQSVTNMTCKLLDMLHCNNIIFA